MKSASTALTLGFVVASGRTLSSTWLPRNTVKFRSFGRFVVLLEAEVQGGRPELLWRHGVGRKHRPLLGEHCLEVGAFDQAHSGARLTPAVRSARTLRTCGRPKGSTAPRPVSDGDWMSDLSRVSRNRVCTDRCVVFGLSLHQKIGPAFWLTGSVRTGSVDLAGADPAAVEITSGSVPLAAEASRMLICP
jgi:hypothetical protein